MAGVGAKSGLEAPLAGLRESPPLGGSLSPLLVLPVWPSTTPLVRVFDSRVAFMGEEGFFTCMPQSKQPQQDWPPAMETVCRGLISWDWDTWFLPVGILAGGPGLG